jgi:hypothetical protein
MFAVPITGWSDAEIEALIREHRSRHDPADRKADRMDYITATISKARASASPIRIEKTAPITVKPSGPKGRSEAPWPKALSDEAFIGPLGELVKRIEPEPKLPRQPSSCR